MQPIGVASPRGSNSRLAGWLALAAAAGLLSSVALWNGFPLVFTDTATYLTPKGPSFRTPFYNAFTSLLRWDRSPWPIVFAQSLLVAWLLRLTTRVFFGWRGPVRFLLLIAASTLFSSLPWFTGQILPDVFSAALVLGLATLGLAAERCTIAERLALTVLVVASVVVHQSHLLLGAAILGLFVIAWPLGSLALDGRECLRAALPVAFATLVLVVSNGRLWGRYTPSVEGASFLLGHTIQHGPTLAYLRESCPERGWALCPHLELLPWRDDESFLWDPEAPFNLAGGFIPLREESRAIVLASLRARPAQFAAAVLRTGWRQLWTFPTGGDNRSYLSYPRPFLTRAMRRFFPDFFPSYLSALQTRGRFPIPAVVRLHELAVAASALASLVLAFRLARRGDPAPARLLIVVAAGVVANAFLTGGLAGVSPRYQSRVMWLPVYFAAAALLASAGSRGASAATHPPEQLPSRPA